MASLKGFSAENDVADMLRMMVAAPRMEAGLGALKEGLVNRR